MRAVWDEGAHSPRKELSRILRKNPLLQKSSTALHKMKVSVSVEIPFGGNFRQEKGKERRKSFTAPNNSNAPCYGRDLPHYLSIVNRNKMWSIILMRKCPCAWNDSKNSIITMMMGNKSLNIPMQRKCRSVTYFYVSIESWWHILLN